MKSKQQILLPVRVLRGSVSKLRRRADYGYSRTVIIFVADLYIKKQQKRCFDCLNALKDNPNETERKEYYRSVYEDITKYINSEQ